VVRRWSGKKRVDAVARVGEAYLRLVERDEHPDGNSVAEPAGATGADAFHRLESEAGAVRRDFEKGDVISVDGWRLSSTEARMAALVALERRRRGRITAHRLSALRRR
jgi:hypothetical protein